MFLIMLWLAALAMVIALAGYPFLREWLRRRKARQPFPTAWRKQLQRLPYYARLPADLKLQLQRHIQVLLAEKEFIGCGGLVIDDEMRLIIAAQACLLLLNRRDGYFPGLHSVLLYPDSFVVNRQEHDALGLMHEQQQVLAGESWSQGKVILSWSDVLAGTAADSPHNVVIHEFAHQLDQQDGAMNGIPPMPNATLRTRWTEVFAREYAQLEDALAHNQPTLLNPYAATNPAEFFAVTSETFFMQPTLLAAQHGELYELLSRYYRIHPLSW